MFKLVLACMLVAVAYAGHNAESTINSHLEARHTVPVVVAHGGWGGDGGRDRGWEHWGHGGGEGWGNRGWGGDGGWGHRGWGGEGGWGRRGWGGDGGWGHRGWGGEGHRGWGGEGGRGGWGDGHGWHRRW